MQNSIDFKLLRLWNKKAKNDLSLLEIAEILKNFEFALKNFNYALVERALSDLESQQTQKIFAPKASQFLSGFLAILERCGQS